MDCIAYLCISQGIMEFLGDGDIKSRAGTASVRSGGKLGCASKGIPERRVFN
jgi:hypothetical protein